MVRCNGRCDGARWWKLKLLAKPRRHEALPETLSLAPGEKWWRTQNRAAALVKEAAENRSELKIE